MVIAIVMLPPGRVRGLRARHDARRHWLHLRGLCWELSRRQGYLLQQRSLQGGFGRRSARDRHVVLDLPAGLDRL